MAYLLTLLIVSISGLFRHVKIDKTRFFLLADFAEKMRPYYHAIGFFGFIAGIVFCVQVVFAMPLMGYGWTLWLLLSVCTTILGFLAGFPKILMIISKDKKKKAEDAYAKFAPSEKTLAIAGLAICVLLLMHIATGRPDIFTQVLMRKVGVQ